MVLKELPKHLKYVFMKEKRFKPFIIANDLILEKKQKVVKILRKYQEAIT